VSSPSFVDQCRPPWVVFPDLHPRELAGYLRQGVTEAYFLNHWRPFWDALDGGQRAQYLDHWNASSEWREAIEFHFNISTKTQRLMRQPMSASRKSTWLAIARSAPPAWRASPGGRGCSNPAIERRAALLLLAAHDLAR
jgi:hypothetical protein